MTTVAVVQARCGSTRFPGKVLADLCGRSMLEHVVDRARRARAVDSVVVATTVDPVDDAVARLTLKLGVTACRGPVDDVLSRYVLAAREHRAGVIVRITADCPLLDPRLIDRVIGRLLRDGAEYASNLIPPTYPDGYDVEAFTIGCLARMDAEATLAYEREHVTPRVREHPEAYRIASVRSRRDLSALRLTVDLPEDLARVAAVLSALNGSAPPGLGAVLRQLARTPELARQAGPPPRDERYVAQRLAAAQELCR